MKWENANAKIKCEMKIEKCEIENWKCEIALWNGWWNHVKMVWNVKCEMECEMGDEIKCEMEYEWNMWYVTRDMKC